MSDTKHTLSYDPNSIYPRGAYGENKCIKMDGEIVAEVFCQSSTSTADHDARVLASDLAHRYNHYPELLEALVYARKWLGDGVNSDSEGLPREYWTPKYSRSIDLIDSALATARA